MRILASCQLKIRPRASSVTRWTCSLCQTLKICGEVELRIHQNLLTLATSMNQIERVYSHEQSLSQCKGWLRDNLPGVELIAVGSNSEAARRVRNAPEAAAIAGRSAADVYGLPVLFSDIEDQAG